MFLTDNIHAQFDAFITDEHSRAGNQFPHLVLALPTERAIEGVFRIAVGRFTHTDQSPQPKGRQFHRIAMLAAGPAVAQTKKAKSRKLSTGSDSSETITSGPDPAGNQASLPLLSLSAGIRSATTSSMIPNSFASSAVMKRSRSSASTTRSSS